jgi:hypothetical protein
MTVQPSEFRSFTWLPRWLTRSKPSPAQRLDGLLSRDDRETVRHAVSSTGAMIGGSMSTGRG